LCSKHIKSNIEEYVKTLHLSERFGKMICNDVFGDRLHEGLYHAMSRLEFDENVAKLKTKWNAAEAEERTRKNLPSKLEFFSYFKKNKLEDIFDCCRQINAINANVYSYNCFTTNETESINNAIKEWQGYATEDLARFVISLKEFVRCQRKEMLKPFINCSSRLIVNPVYKEHVKANYWEMSDADKRDIIKSISKIRLMKDSVAILPPGSTNESNDEGMQVGSNLEESWDNLEDYLSPGFVQDMKQKMFRLATDKKIRIGFGGPKSRIISSTSATGEVHFVSCHNFHEFKCTCANYKSFKVCSHSLASANDNNLLAEFISSVVKKSHKPQLTPIATSGGSKFAGQKPNQSTRKRPRSNKESRHEIPNRQTLKEALNDIEADEQLQHGRFKVVEKKIGNRSLTLKMSRGSKAKPKPKYQPTLTTPFCLVDISGNISKCAGCRGNLKDGPSDNNPDELDTSICIRHKEKDHVWLRQKHDWLMKFENKYYHISKNCISSRNPTFNGDDLLLHFLEAQPLSFSVKEFLKDRLY